MNTISAEEKNTVTKRTFGPIPYGRQHITEEDLKAVSETLLSDYLTQGPKIAEFENAFAKYIGCKYAVAVALGLQSPGSARRGERTSGCRASAAERPWT